MIRFARCCMAALLLFVGLRRTFHRQASEQERLQESQRQLKTLLSNLPGMAYRSQPTVPWRMEFVSEGVRALTGYDDAAFTGARRIGWLDLIHPDDRAWVQRDVAAALHTRQPFQLTYRIHTAAGEQKWVWEQGRAILVATGEVVALEGFVADTTELVEARHHLEEQVARRTRELSALLEVTHHLVSTVELEPLVALILEQLRQVVPYSGAAILRHDEGALHVVARHDPDALDEEQPIWFNLARLPQLRAVLEQHESFWVENLQADSDLLAALRQSREPHVADALRHIRSLLVVPLVVQGQNIGVLSVAHAQPNFYGEQHVWLARAFADQAALAIRNAQLYQHVQETAAADERQRLARELHDSVTQALYSVLLYADAARRALVAGKQETVTEHVQAVGAMAREAMLDMRLLIWELRPPMLAEEGLVGALQARLDTVEARAGLATTLRVTGEARIPPRVEGEESCTASYRRR